MKTFLAFLAPAALLIFIPVLALANSGDFNGGVAIGSSYAGIDTAPTNGLIVQGNIGIGTTSPAQTLEVNGTVKIDTGLITSLTYPPSDSTTAIQIDKANGTTNIVDIDTTNNRVGIGTTSPGEKLDVAGDARLTANIPILYLNGTEASGKNIALYENAGYFRIDVASVQGLMSINGANGNVGIGNETPSYFLHVGSSSSSGIMMELQNSSGACTYNPGASSVTVSCSSDMRLKTDIGDSKGALAWVDDMRVRDFTIKSTGERKTGVVAQEVMLKHPEMVHQNAEGTYLVDEPNPWKLVKAIQEQQAEIDGLKQTIEQLKRHK